jgi:hypothetical protein
MANEPECIALKPKRPRPEQMNTAIAGADGGDPELLKAAQVR